MLMKNQDDIKKWLMDQGWVPTMWNYKKGKDKKPMRDPITKDYIKTSPKLQEKNKLCPNLEQMEGPLAKQIVRWLSLRNRQAVLKTWLGNSRLCLDGRLGAASIGIATTHRQKHMVVVNVPKASPDVVLGKEFRSLFIAEDGNVLVGFDASALEARVEGHFTYPYDGGSNAKELLQGDVHSKNAKIFYPDETKKFDIQAKDFKKDDPGFKPYRDRSKNGRYALAYGCTPKKLAATLGQPEEKGGPLYDAFWAGSPGLKAFKDKLEKYWHKHGKKRVPSVSGAWLNTRSKHSLVNTVFQNCGAEIMDYAGCLMDAWLGGLKYDEEYKPHYIYKGYIVKRVGYWHDEYLYECPEQIAEEIGKMGVKSIKQAGKALKIRVELDGEYKIGHSWADTH
jgi:DNA polymerase I-like protein with 3'-5' exonuclease and polymerase domains